MARSRKRSRSNCNRKTSRSRSRRRSRSSKSTRNSRCQSRTQKKTKPRSKSRSNCRKNSRRRVSRSRNRSRSKSKSNRNSRGQCRKQKKVKSRSKSRSKCRKKSRRRVKSQSPKRVRSKNRAKVESRTTKSCSRVASKAKSQARLPVKQSRSRKKATKGDASESEGTTSESEGESEEPEPKSKVLEQPHVSPRDPNHYRMIELDNGFRALLISTCGYGTNEAEAERSAAAEKNSCAPKSNSVFSRQRWKRERSEDEEKRKKKPSRESSSQVKTCPNKSKNSTNTKGHKENSDDDGSSIIEHVVDYYGPFEALEPETKKTDGCVNDEEPDYFSPEDEPEDDDLKNAACAYVRKSSPQVEIALTISCGSLNDPPNLRGISNLTWKAIERKLKKSGIQAKRDEGNMVTATTITMTATAESLEKTLNVLAKTVTVITTNRYEILKDIDNIDEMEEVVQCFFCWHDPMEDERRQALLCSLAKEGHPLRHVSYRGFPPELWDAEENQDLVKVLEDFLAECYVGKAMTLAIKAPEKLDTLDRLVTKAFASVSNGDLGDIVGEPDPFDTEEFYKLYFVKCTNPGCCDTGDAFMVISWALPAEFWENYESKPLEYLAALISNKSPGGLSDLLKEKKLSPGVEASCRNTGFHRNQFYSFFEIQVRLNEKGFTQFYDVLETVFSYLNFLRSEGPQEKLYREMQKLRSIQFNALGLEVDLMNPYPTCAKKISTWLQFYSPEEVMMAPHLLKSYDGTIHKLLQDTVDLLVPEKANFMLCSCFEEPFVALSQVEPIYSTQYEVKEITPDQIACWSNASAEFEFPEPNPFISSHLCLSIPETDSKGPILYDPGKPANYRIWYQQSLDDIHFTLSYVHIISTSAFSGPENAVMLTIWYLCLKDLLEPLLFQATVASIHYNIQPTHQGILVTVYSWNHRMKKAREIIISEILRAGLNVSSDLYLTKKTEWLRHLSGELKDIHFSCYMVAHDIYESIIVVDHWPSGLLHSELKNLDYEDFKVFTLDFCKNSTFAAFLRGNVVRETVVDLAEFFENNFPWCEGTVDDFGVRMAELPLGERVLRMKSFSEYGGDVHVSNFYQIGPADPMSRLCALIMRRLLSLEMNREFMDRLAEKRKSTTGKRPGKKQKQKGKKTPSSEPVNNGAPDDWLWMYSEIRYNQGIMTLRTMCEGSSPRNNVDDLECLLDTFMDKFLEKTLCPMQTKEFNVLKNSMRQAFVTLTGAGGNYYQELCTELAWHYEAVKTLTFWFEEAQLMMECLNKLTLVGLQNWFRDHCTQSGCGFRKLSVQIIPKPQKPEPPSKVKVSLPPNTKQEWRDRRKQVRDCTYKDYHRIIHLHKPNRDETFVLTLQPENGQDTNCQNQYFITDLPNFKSQLYEYPEDMADD